MIIWKRYKHLVGAIVIVMGENGRKTPGRVTGHYFKRVSSLRYKLAYAVRYCPHGSKLYRTAVLLEHEIETSKEAAK